MNSPFNLLPEFCTDRKILINFHARFKYYHMALARISTSTLAAPALNKTFAHSFAVAPVVQTSCKKIKKLNPRKYNSILTIPYNISTFINQAFYINKSKSEEKDRYSGDVNFNLLTNKIQIPLCERNSHSTPPRSAWDAQWKLSPLQLCWADEAQHRPKAF